MGAEGVKHGGLHSHGCEETQARVGMPLGQLLPGNQEPFSCKARYVESCPHHAATRIISLEVEQVVGRRVMALLLLLLLSSTAAHGTAGRGSASTCVTTRRGCLTMRCFFGIPVACASICATAVGRASGLVRCQRLAQPSAVALLFRAAAVAARSCCYMAVSSRALLCTEPHFRFVGA